MKLSCHAVGCSVINKEDLDGKNNVLHVLFEYQP